MGLLNVAWESSCQVSTGGSALRDLDVFCEEVYAKKILKDPVREQSQKLPITEILPDVRSTTPLAQLYCKYTLSAFAMMMQRRFFRTFDAVDGGLGA